MSSKTHNKKRNVILMYEFLVRAISRALIENDKKTQAIALKILKKNFKQGTELYKEFRIANALYKTTVSNSSVASSIMSEAKNVIKSLNWSKLDREKSILIREVNYGFKNESFYDTPVSNYKIFATIQTLFNEWNNSTDLSKLAEYEDRLNNWLVESKEIVDESLTNNLDDGTTRLVTKIMTQKLNEKYAHMNDLQRSLIKTYMLSESSLNNDSTRIVLEKIKHNVLEVLSGQDITKDERLQSVQSMIVSEDFSQINDDVVSRFMMFAQLIDEIKKDVK